MTRLFRLFVSSTFEDLQMEREALHTRVFPELAELCLKRGARFQPIDLRWGVSEEAGRDQRTMQICFEEIARCQRQTRRPNFLVLLGDRYGWRPVPTSIPADEFAAILDGLVDQPADRRLVERWYHGDDNAVPPTHVLRPRASLEGEQWLPIERQLHEALRTGAAGLPVEPARRLRYEASATHLEIERGVFSVPDAAEHVVCALRSIDGLPADSSAAPFLDMGRDGQPDEDARRRLAELRGQLRRRLPDTLLEYRATWSAAGPTTDHLDDLCAAVRARLWSLIESELAEASVDAPAEEVAAHWSFAETRIASAGDERPGEDGDTVLGYFAGDRTAPLIVTGAGGVGKTTFAAQVARRLRSYPNTDVFLRFVGATADSASAPTLLGGLAREVGSRYELDESIPAGYGALVSELWSRLESVPEGRRAAVIVDGVDLLGTGRGIGELDWLPARLPPRVGVLVTAAPGPTRDLLLALPEREVVELAPLTRQHGGAILDRWLAERGRTLRLHQRDQVLDRFAVSGLPFYLRVAMEEAARWESDRPPGKTRLEADVAGIVRALIGRLSDGAEHGAVLVTRTLAYLTCAKSGLAEDELLAVLAADDAVMAELRRRFPRSPSTQDLPVAVWSRLLSDLAPYLAERRADGAQLLGFFHRLFKEVVDEDCAGAERRQRHDQLARYFSARPLDPGVPNVRALTELPYQLAAAGRERDLVATLTDFAFLEAKLRALGPQPLLDDYTLPHAPERGLVDLAEVLERVSAVLAERPAELASQLQARLLDLDDEPVRALLGRARREMRRPWLRPLTRSLSPPGGPLIRTISTRGGSVSAVALTPDGRRALAACRDGRIEVWDIEHGALARTLYGHGVFARCVAVAPDGHRAVSGARARPNEDPQELRVWDLDQGRPIAMFEGHDHDFGEIAVLPDGRRAVSSSYDGTVRVWDLDDGHAIHVLRGHAWYVQALSVSADGRVAASGADDGTIRIWDLERGQAIRVLETDHPLRAASPDEIPPGGLIGITQVTGVALSPDGRLLVSTSPQEGMCFWDVDQGTQLARLPVYASHPRITSDGHRLVLLLGAVQVWDLETRRKLGQTNPIAPLPSALALSDDGRFAVVGEGSELSVWRLEQIVGGRPEPARGASATAIVEDEEVPIAVVATSQTLEGWDLGTGDRLWQNPGSGALDLAPVPGRGAVVAGRWDGAVELVNARSGASVIFGDRPHGERPAGKLEAERRGDVLDLGDGLILEAQASAAAPEDEHAARRIRAVSDSLFVMDDPPPDDEPVSREEDAPAPVRAVAVAPDGHLAAAASDDAIDIWDLQAGQLRHRIINRNHDAKALAVTPDGSLLVSLADRGAYAGDRNLRRWDLASGREINPSPTWLRRLRRLRGPDLRSSMSSPNQIRPLAITADGNRAVSALAEGLHVWDLRGDGAPRILSDSMQEEAIAALPGQRVLAPEGYNAARLLVWDLDAGRAVGELLGHVGGVSTLAVSADGRRALSAGRDFVIYLWDLTALTPIATFTIEDFPIICALTANGDTAVVGDRRTLHLLRLEDGNPTA